MRHKDADGVSRLVAPVRASTTTARSQQAAARTSQSKHDVTKSYLSGTPDPDTLAEEQANDPLCRVILQRLGHLPVDDSDPVDSQDVKRLLRIKGLRGNLSRFSVEDGILYHTAGPDKDLQPPVPLAPESMRPSILESFHDHLGHISASKMTPLIQRAFYWPYLKQSVSAHVARCHECTLAKPPKTQPRQPTGPTVGRYPFDVLYTDILDMVDSHDYDRTKGTGARKLVVFIDSLSRWVEAIPVLTDPTSEQLLDIFMEHIVSRHGVPTRIVSDAGSNVASRLCDKIYEACGAALHPTAAEHHEGIGVVERFHRTLQNMARATDEGGANWPEHLPFLLISPPPRPPTPSSVSRAHAGALD